VFFVASEISYKFATYFYRREFRRLIFCHIVNGVDKTGKTYAQKRLASVHSIVGRGSLIPHHHFA